MSAELVDKNNRPIQGSRVEDNRAATFVVAKPLFGGETFAVCLEDETSGGRSQVKATIGRNVPGFLNNLLCKTENLVPQMFGPGTHQLYNGVKIRIPAQSR